MPDISVKTLEGETKSLSATTGAPLMECLRDAGLVDATCGGMASCGTCHVYIHDEKLVGEQTEDEGYMLEGLADFVDVRPNSRLSCQMTVTDALNGVHIEIVEDA